jgi:hypothetical protein
MPDSRDPSRPSRAKSGRRQIGTTEVDRLARRIKRRLGIGKRPLSGADANACTADESCDFTLKRIPPERVQTVNGRATSSAHSKAPIIGDQSSKLKHRYINNLNVVRNGPFRSLEIEIEPPKSTDRQAPERAGRRGCRRVSGDRFDGQRGRGGSIAEDLGRLPQTIEGMKNGTQHF